MFYRCICLFLLISSSLEDRRDTYRLESILNALYKTLFFLKNHIHEINLDAVLGARLVEGQLNAYLEFEPHIVKSIRPQLSMLRDLASNVADEGQINVYKNDKEYAESAGSMMERYERLLWHPTKRINHDFMVLPVPCSHSAFNEDKSDQCFKQMLGSRNERKDSCFINEDCEALNREPRQRGYILTHQVLFWQYMEMRNCSKTASPNLMTYLCSNVMRDALEIEEALFPLNHQDLFMEQISLCGMWGFRDFYKPDWLDEILKWQLPSGCYAHRAKWHCSDHLTPDFKTKTKRREKLLEDGCLSHKTAVASLALAVSLRFEAEKLFN